MKWEVQFGDEDYVLRKTQYYILGHISFINKQMYIKSSYLVYFANILKFALQFNFCFVQKRTAKKVLLTSKVKVHVSIHWLNINIDLTKFYIQGKILLVVKR